MPKFDVRRIAKGDGSESVVRVEAADAADAQRVAMDDLFLIGNATPVAESAPSRAGPAKSLVALRLTGAVLVILGVLSLTLSLQMGTTTETDLGRSVHNIGRMQAQTMSVAVSLAMSLAGWLTFVLAECVEVVCRVLVRVS